MYQVVIEKHIEKQLQKVPRGDYLKIKTLILNLASNPRPASCKKLKSIDAYRIRHGNYRIIYEIHDLILTVIVIEAGHRKSIYK